ESGLVTITGGKWTTYRKMAVDAVDTAIRTCSLPARPSSTASLKLHGWQAGADGDDGAMAVYGSDARRIRALCEDHPEWNEPVVPSLPYIGAEVIWAARHEAARSVEDVLARRTRALFLDARASVDAAPRVAALLAAELERDHAWQEGQVSHFRELAAG